ncbi:hypothetical protein FRC11_003258 [Ceratobasidium sp. 423]|nr:hypothetical protein FRC11_003258 [Ceratobasidium sp. 423]
MEKVIDVVASHLNLMNPTSDESQGFARLRLRLMPLRIVESSIVKSLSSPNGIARAWSNGRRNEKGLFAPAMVEEYDDVVVHPESLWQRLRQRCAQATSTIKTGLSPYTEYEGMVETKDDPAMTLEACATDMQQLWGCSMVRRCLMRAGLFIEEISGFFLDDIERITSPGYVPTDGELRSFPISFMQ